VVPSTVRPTFLVIGAYKCGTTSLHHYLRSHPDVFVPERKEPNHWAFAHGPDPVVERARNPAYATSIVDRSEYDALFAGAAGHAAVGEVSPEYLTHPMAAANIAAELPDVRLAAILRNPVERAWSDYLMYVRDGLERETDFGRALDLQAERAAAGDPTGFYVTTGRYGEQLGRYLERFDREQLLVVLTEDLQRDRQATMARIFEHLGVDPGFEVPELQEFNRSGVPANAAVRAAYTVRHRFAPYVRNLLPGGVKRAIDERLQRGLDRRDLAETDRRRLGSELRADVELLQATVGVDVSHWLTGQEGT
jgi:hypothetical protein